MLMVGWLVLVAVVMWVLQTALGLWQFQRFNRHVKELRSIGKVAIGKARGRFRAGAIVLFCIDEDCNILQGEILQGRTVFAGFRRLDRWNGRNLLELSEKDCEGVDPQAKAAVLAARRDYEDYRKLQAERAADQEAASGAMSAGG
ncbi:MAG: transcriptional regulator GutM [Selenomonadaceae bacterium]|nr:transcriptional regulator GutM [Selenomonadaceae bacterium]MBR6343498.1 transcriptional regulator GutM [Selenomonadaceae bacterium]